MLPINFTEIVLKDLIISIFQSVLLTVSMMYSYYFYKDHFSDLIKNECFDVKDNNIISSELNFNIDKDKKDN